MTTSLKRRTFLKAVVSTSFATAVDGAWSSPRKPVETASYKLVAASDRERILAPATRYVSLTPATITSFPTIRSAGSPHDFYSQADYFWPNPKDPDGPYINRDGQSNPDNFDDHRKVMIALSIQMPALTAAWLLTGESRYAHKACDHLPRRERKTNKLFPAGSWPMTDFARSARRSNPQRMSVASAASQMRGP